MTDYLPEPSVVIIAEDFTVIEARVSLSYPRPEAVLFDAITNWLAQTDHRRAIVGTSISYDSDDHTIVAVVVFGEPLEHQDDD